MDTLQNAPTSNKLINYSPNAEIAGGLMLGIAVCGIMPAGGAAVLCIMTACGAAGVVFALLRHTRSALYYKVVSRKVFGEIHTAYYIHRKSFSNLIS